MALYSYGPIQLWPYTVMAPYSYGPIQLWPYIGMATLPGNRHHANKI